MSTVHLPAPYHAKSPFVRKQASGTLIPGEGCSAYVGDRGGEDDACGLAGV